MTKNQTVRVSLAQLPCADGDRDSNMESIARAMRQAASQGGQIVVFPEMILTGYVPRDRLMELAEPVDGPHIREVAFLCRELGVSVVLGFPEKAVAGYGEPCVYNSAAFINSAGRVDCVYRKVHLFGQERELFAEGEAVRPFSLDLPGGTPLAAGLMICFDLEFPEPARQLALAGASVLFVPSANMVPYRRHHRVFLRARSMENHVFVVYCNRVGCGQRHTFVGDSAVCDPLGRFVAGISGQGAGVVTAEVSLEAVERSRASFDYLRQRRLAFNPCAR